MEKVFGYLKYSPFYELAAFFLFRLQKRNWYKRGQRPPTPNLIKQAFVKKYAKKYCVNIFIETGTYLGSMISSVKNNFKKIYTIELDSRLYKRARNKFKNSSHIKIIRGDSAKVLPEILKTIKEKALFWLDAHFSKGITARSDKETPVIEELNCVLNHPIKNHVILIDDADSFKGIGDYPTLKYLKDFILSKNPNLAVSVKKNIIAIIPIE